MLYHGGELDPLARRRPVRRADPPRADAAPADPRDRVFVAAAVSLSFWLVLEVAAFASEQSLRVEERNMFYVAPLFLIALLLWIERGCAAAAAGACVGSAARRRASAARCRTTTASASTRSPTRLRCCRSAGSSRTCWRSRTPGSSSSPAPSYRPRVPLRAGAATRSRCRRSCFVYFAVSQYPIEDAASLPLGAAPVRGDRDAASRLDRPRGRPRRGGGAAVDRQHRRVSDLGERVLQPERRHVYTTGRCCSRATSPRRHSRSTEAPATCASPTEAACR